MIKIDKATINDYDEINRLTKEIAQFHKEIMPERFKDILVKDYDKDTFLEEVNNPSDLWLVARDGDKVVGTLLVYITSDSTNTIFAYIDNLMVDKDYQSKGVGSKLYLEACNFAKEQNVNLLQLDVWADNKNALQFYQNHGMSPLRYILKKEI